ncbi:SUMF1/EgtB/PvdO family nonheme iron enzyme [Candidatus Poribacteria bacterium]|nr:SUMF1/EgtB/PvdO family nonheme iron enzyme [Candidatus Poribacteria bacterium]
MKRIISFSVIAGLLLFALLGTWVVMSLRYDVKPVTSDMPSGMVLIPAGKFLMGGGSYRQSVIYLDSYYIDIYEVTNQDYEKFILDGGYHRRELWSKEGWEFIKENQIEMPANWIVKSKSKASIAPHHPVVGISWYEAQAYAKWAGKRLPTEAEWEKAARGTDGRRYPWGNEFDWTRVSYGGLIRLLNVGAYPKGTSIYGCFDMSGNVWEWCSDWYSESDYPSDRGPDMGTYRVLRGGSWSSTRLQLQCNYRYYALPTTRAFDIGFRCAKDVK